MKSKVGKKWKGHHEEQVRKLLPIGEKIRAKDIINKAKKNHISPNTVYACLDVLVAEGSVKKFREKPKEVYFLRFEDVRVEKLIESFFSEFKLTLLEMPDEVKATRKGVMDFVDFFLKGSNLSQNEQDEITGEIDKRGIGRIAYSLLLKRVFETIKMVEPEFKNEEFYVDADGSFVPKEWVDKEISFEKRLAWLTEVFKTSRPNENRA